MMNNVMTNATLADRLAAARKALEPAGQAHLLKFFDSLQPAQRDSLLAQIESVDWNEVARLIPTHVRNKPTFEQPSDIRPAPYYPHSAKNHPELKDKYKKALKLGRQLISEGKVAAFTVAGGQGTRLGWEGPKGTFPATPIRKLPLFAVLAEYIRKAQSKFETVIPWYIMTSTDNDTATRGFFEAHGYFGLEPANVLLFPQQMMPAFDIYSGKVLLTEPDTIALSPNGHGGSLKALHASGALADMQRRGIEQISYTQIDNPSAHVVDPLFLGLHALDEAQMSSKMVHKTGPDERVGNFCLVDGRITIIEYSDLPQELAAQLDANGSLRFNAGSIAIHAIAVDFVRSLNSNDGFALPYHRAEKKVPFFDTHSGQPVAPDEPNTIKLETFVFDALPLCERSIVYETNRIEEFAPIKNAAGVDSPESSKRLQIERAGRWLEANDVKVARNHLGDVDAVIELMPLTAIAPEDLENVELPKSIDPGTQVLL